MDEFCATHANSVECLSHTASFQALQPTFSQYTPQLQNVQLLGAGQRNPVNMLGGDRTSGSILANNVISYPNNVYGGGQRNGVNVYGGDRVQQFSNTVQQSDRFNSFQDSNTQFADNLKQAAVKSGVNQFNRESVSELVQNEASKLAARKDEKEVMSVQQQNGEGDKSDAKGHDTACPMFLCGINKLLGRDNSNQPKEKEDDCVDHDGNVEIDEDLVVKCDNKRHRLFCQVDEFKRLCPVTCGTCVPDTAIISETSRVTRNKALSDIFEVKTEMPQLILLEEEQAQVSKALSSNFQMNTQMPQLTLLEEQSHFNRALNSKYEVSTEMPQLVLMEDPNAQDQVSRAVRAKDFNVNEIHFEESTFMPQLMLEEENGLEAVDAATNDGAAKNGQEGHGVWKYWLASMLGLCAVAVTMFLCLNTDAEVDQMVKKMRGRVSPKLQTEEVEVGAYHKLESPHAGNAKSDNVDIPHGDNVLSIEEPESKETSITTGQL